MWLPEAERTWNGSLSIPWMERRAFRSCAFPLRHRDRARLIRYEGLAERPIQPEDEPFLRALFLDTREALAASLAGNLSAGDLLDMQFRARESFYRSQFPKAVRTLFLLEGRPAGYWVIDRNARSLHLVDIAFLKEFRGSGIGSAVLESLIEESQAAGLPITLHVAHDNPARRLYERLGFEEVSRTETDAAMKRVSHFQRNL